MLSYPFQQFDVAWVTTWIKIWCRTCVSVSFFEKQGLVRAWVRVWDKECVRVWGRAWVRVWDRNVLEFEVGHGLGLRVGHELGFG